MILTNFELCVPMLEQGVQPFITDISMSIRHFILCFLNQVSG